MKLPPLVEGRLILRRNRFVAEVELADGSRVEAHCPNTGSMMGCKAARQPRMVIPRRQSRTQAAMDLGTG